jgi:hypothetical protein
MIAISYRSQLSVTGRQSSAKAGDQGLPDSVSRYRFYIFVMCKIDGEVGSVPIRGGSPDCRPKADDWRLKTDD